MDACRFDRSPAGGGEVAPGVDYYSCPARLPVNPTSGVDTSAGRPIGKRLVGLLQ